MGDTPHSFHPAIVREYDIRGRVGETLGPADALALGKAFGTFVRERRGNRICVGYDGRDSSPDLCRSLTEGLLSTGVNVESVGLGPSPMLYFAVRDTMADGGIMVTGSHNPVGDNGFKTSLTTGPVFGEALKSLCALREYAAGTGVLREAPQIRGHYIDRLLRDLDMARPLKVAWDAGNGAAGAVLKDLTDRVPGTHILLYESVDGTFPNHHPDPTVDSNLEDLRRTVLEEGCDLGVAFDGDGDRIGAVDAQGNIVRCDTLLALYAREVLATNPGAPIVGDVKSSQALYDDITAHGGQPVMWKSGHSPLKAKMTELKAPLAGELSGHVFFGDKYYGFDDGLYCAIRLLNIVAGAPDGLAGLVAGMPVYVNTPEVRIPVPESGKFGLIEKIRDALIPDAQERGLKIYDMDGIRVHTEEGWWLLRASNTESAIVARAEAKTPEGLDRLKRMVYDESSKHGYAFSL